MREKALASSLLPPPLRSIAGCATPAPLTRSPQAAGRALRRSRTLARNGVGRTALRLREESFRREGRQDPEPESTAPWN